MMPGGQLATTLRTSARGLLLGRACQWKTRGQTALTFRHRPVYHTLDGMEEGASGSEAIGTDAHETADHTHGCRPCGSAASD